ncbi:hypothetical protein LCGC14_2485360, partial [marine sediment metagenome]
SKCVESATVPTSNIRLFISSIPVKPSRNTISPNSNPCDALVVTIGGSAFVIAETETVAFGSQDMVDPPDSKGEIETKDIKRIFAKLHGLGVSDTLAQHEVVSEILGFNSTLPSMNYLSVAQGDKVVTALMRREKAQR